MRRLLVQTASAFALWALTSSTALGGWLSPCATARLVASWRHHGFWRTSAIYAPPTSVDGHRVRLVGRLRVGARAYKIFFDEHSEPGSEAHDSTQDLVVTSGRGTFLGLYNVNDIVDLYGEPIKTEGSDILFPAGKANGEPWDNRIHFGPAGPPKTVRRFFGYDLTFDTPADFRSAREGSRREPAPRSVAHCRQAFR